MTLFVLSLYKARARDLFASEEKNVTNLLFLTRISPFNRVVGYRSHSYFMLFYINNCQLPALSQKKSRSFSTKNLSFRYFSSREPALACLMQKHSNEDFYSLNRLEKMWGAPTCTLISFHVVHIWIDFFSSLFSSLLLASLTSRSSPCRSCSCSLILAR